MDKLDHPVQMCEGESAALTFVPGRTAEAGPARCEHGCTDLSRYHEAALGIGSLSAERRAIIQRIRREIASGTYESTAKVEFAARALALRLNQTND